MTLKEYEKECLRTANGGTKNLTEKERLMLNGCMGLAGESGEIVDVIKKHIFHGHPLDIESCMKELGDVHWYWSILCYVLNLDPEEVLKQNVQKLRKRYPDGFGTLDSILRRDKDEK